jgi:TRAP-type mannitol/chloroaromatic compound transport system permease small subunit
MRKVLQTIDNISEWAGRLASWFAVGLVLLVVLEVFMRYAVKQTLMWSTETDLMFGTTIYCAGWAYAHRHNAHIRIDILYLQMPPRVRATFDVVGTFFLFFPVALVFIQSSFRYMMRSLIMGELSNVSFWYPPIWPWRAIVLLGFILLTLQALAHFYRDVYLMIRNKTYD